MYTKCNAYKKHIYFVEEKKRLINVLDVLGRQAKELKNQSLFYIYDDGTVEKKKFLNK